VPVELQSFFFQKFLVWSAILSRIAGIFLFSPFYGGRIFPTGVKIIFPILLSYMVLPSVDQVLPLTIPLSSIVLIEFLNFSFGLAAGMVANVLFYALSFAGDIYGYQLGFAAASIYDPQTESESVVVSQLVTMICLYLFVLIKGPLVLLQFIIRSFQTVPVAILGVGDEFAWSFAGVMGKVLEFGMQLGLPMIVFMLLVTFVLGIMSKLMPQLNVFIVGLPLKVMVGLFIMVGLLPVWAEILVKYVRELEDWIGNVLHMF